MEGKATFTLTNAKTGRTVRQFTEHNLVTDAVKRILNPPGYAMMYSFNWSGFLSAALPLYKTLFGGIMLLGNNLSERADNIMLSPDCIPVATAGDAYSGAVATRGTLNINETYPMENGYHFTWDFGTDKANGTIKCAALTSRLFGNTGFGNNEKTGALLVNTDTLSLTSMKSQFCKASGQYVCSIGERRHIYYVYNSDKSLTFSVVETVDPNVLGINDSGSLSEPIAPVSSETVTLPIDIATTITPFYDSINRILYFFEKKTEGSTFVKFSCAGVSLPGFTATDSMTWELPYERRYANALAYYNGRLFLADSAGIFSCGSAGDVTLISNISCTGDSDFFITNGVLNLITASGSGAVFLNGQFYVSPTLTTNVISSSTDILPPYYPVCNMSYPIYTTSENSRNPYLGLATDYFATINNLGEPLEKTSEHTLKITYDITN